MAVSSRLHTETSTTIIVKEESIIQRIMKVTAAVVMMLVAVVAARHNQILPGVKVNQCAAQDLECPVFKDVKIYGKEYERRSYVASKWVGTMMETMHYDEQESSEQFNKLFSYIAGQNDQKKTIDMTAPVLTRVQPGAGPNCKSNFTMSFFVPSALWENTPNPTGDGVFLHEMQAMNFYVRAFDGFASTDDFVMEVSQLARDLGSSDNYVVGEWFMASYDSPFKFWDRRNEVWLIATTK